MTEDLQNTQPNGASAGAPRTYQSPPVLRPEISAAELAAIEGPAKHSARTFSAQMATFAGAAGGAIIDFLITGAKTTGRGFKVLAGAILGGFLGHTLSDLPWTTKQTPVETPIALPPVGIPTAPIPTPAPSPHPAAPTASVAASEYSGRVQDSSPQAELSA